MFSNQYLFLISLGPPLHLHTYDRLSLNLHIVYSETSTMSICYCIFQQYYSSISVEKIIPTQLILRRLPQHLHQRTQRKPRTSHLAHTQTSPPNQSPYRLGTVRTTQRRLYYFHVVEIRQNHDALLPFKSFYV